MQYTLLGPDIEHRRSLEVMLSGAGQVHWLPDSSTFLRSRHAGWLERQRRRLSRIWGTNNAAYLEAMRVVLAPQGDRPTVVAYWGTEPLADLMAARRLSPRARLVLMVLCYPVALDAVGLQRQNWMMRRCGRLIDGVLFANEAMRDHFIAEGLVPASMPHLVLPPCWPADFQVDQAQQQPPAMMAQPNVVFIGRTDLSSTTVHAADDLRPLMRGLLDAGIELHHAGSPETTDGHPLRKPFSPMDQPTLLRFMAGFDASLIAYNTEACQVATRFELTVPDRLISSVAAGVPLAVPAQGYCGLKQYLATQGYEALIEFKDPADLYRQLADREQVRRLKDRAWAARGRFVAERQGPALQAFLASLP